PGFFVQSFRICALAASPMGHRKCKHQQSHKLMCKAKFDRNAHQKCCYADGGLNQYQSDQNHCSACMGGIGCNLPDIECVNNCQCQQRISKHPMNKLHCFRVLEQIEPPW